MKSLTFTVVKGGKSMCGLALKLGVNDKIVHKADIETGEETSSKIEEIAVAYNRLKAEGIEPVVRFELCFD